MKLIEVTNAALAGDFIRVNVELNQLNPNYIRPLDKDVEDVFDPARNKTFRHGECTRWVLHDDQGKRIGRIAAFVNKKYRNKGDENPVGGIGFFDCINDPAAAELLFDVSKHWLLQRGMDAMDGPINFGDDFGARADGKSDVTAAFQKALTSFGAGGGTVYVPRGTYLFKGSLNIPQAVTLKGAFESVPSHNGIRNQGLPKPGDADRTVTMLTVSVGEVADPARWRQTLATEEKDAGKACTSYTGDPGDGYGCTYDSGVWVDGARVNVLRGDRLIRVTVMQWVDATPAQRLALAEDIARDVDANVTAYDTAQG